jgi:hypothetical protein
MILSFTATETITAATGKRNSDGLLDKPIFTTTYIKNMN